MSDELRLPETLAACEARLAAIGLPASGIDRDQLLYRAGWAAGAETARLAVASPVRSNGAVKGGIIAAWSLTSAAVAASLAVMLTLQARPREAAEVVVDPANVVPAAVANTRERPANEFTNVVGTSARRNRFDVGLLSLRREALSNALAASPSAAAASSGAGIPSAKTARELMGELLPEGSSGSTGIWPGKKTGSGDSI